MGEQRFSRGGEPINAFTAKYYASKATYLGWFAGLAWYGLISPFSPLTWWELALLATVGAFVAGRFIWVTLSTIAAGITYKLTGNMEGSGDIFAWTVFIGPVVAFVAARYAVWALA
jgi:hypothetical protein